MKKGPVPKQEKICKACGLIKPRSDFYKKGTSVQTLCKPCSIADHKTRKHLYKENSDAVTKRWHQTKYKESAEYRERISQQKKKRYERLKEQLNAAMRVRWASDPNDPARKHFRSKYVKQRTPRWVDHREITRIYWNCPEGFEVDHLVPLKGLIDGRPVSGLHVPWNLQYLTKEQNRKKYNRISESDLLRASISL